VESVDEIKKQPTISNYQFISAKQPTIIQANNHLFMICNYQFIPAKQQTILQNKQPFIYDK
jgi:hypothetical protein